MAASDVDPNPDSFGSRDPDSESGGIKGKAEFYQQIFGTFFRKKLYFSSLNLKK